MGTTTKMTSTMTSTSTSTTTSTTKATTYLMKKIDFDEIFMSSLTSPTTCYTGSKRPFVRERRQQQRQRNHHDHQQQKKKHQVQQQVTQQQEQEQEEDANGSNKIEVDFDFQVKSYHLATEYHVLTTDVVDKVEVGAAAAAAAETSTIGVGGRGEKNRQQQPSSSLHPLIKTSSRPAVESAATPTNRQAAMKGGDNSNDQRRRRGKPKQLNKKNWICGGYSEWTSTSTMTTKTRKMMKAGGTAGGKADDAEKDGVYYCFAGGGINESVVSSISSNKMEENVVQAYVLLDPSQPTIIENELVVTTSSPSPSPSPSTTIQQPISGNNNSGNAAGASSSSRKDLTVNSEDPRYAAGLRLIEKDPSSSSSSLSTPSAATTATTTTTTASYPTYASSGGNNTKKKNGNSRSTSGGPGGSETAKFGGDDVDGASISQQQQQQHHHNHRRIPSSATMSTSNTSLSNTSNTVQTSGGGGGIVAPPSSTTSTGKQPKPHHHKTISELSTLSTGSGVSTGSGTARSTTADINDSQHQPVSSSGKKRQDTAAAAAAAAVTAANAPKARLIVKKFRSASSCSMIEQGPKKASKVSQLLLSIQLEEVEVDPQRNLSYDIPLSFRPLSPCVVPSWWPLQQQQQEHQYCVWVGSADDARLRLYVEAVGNSIEINQNKEVDCFADDDSTSKSNPDGVASTSVAAADIENPNDESDFAEQQRPPSEIVSSMTEQILPKEHFSVETPVLCIDYKTVTWNTDYRNHESDDTAPNRRRRGGGAETTAKTSHILALSCQDGTIKLIMWDDEEDNDIHDTKESEKPAIPFHNIRHHKVMIDGPVVCLRLDFCKSANLLRVVAGSLCGYACQLLYDHSHDSWHGPYMLIQGIWNPLIGQEDAILSVDIYDNYLAVGTHAGRCCLFATENSETYFKVWECILPYSVNEVAISNDPHSDDRRRKNDQIDLAVTTRRSFHLFRSTTSTSLVDWKIKPHACPPQYSSDLAQRRLDVVLESIKRKNEEANVAKQVVVGEVMEDLITRVVEMDPFPVPVVVPDNTVEGQDRDFIIPQNTNDGTSLSTASQPSEQVAADIQNPPLEYSDSEEEDNLNSNVASDEQHGRESISFTSEPKEENDQDKSSDNDIDDSGGDDDYVLVDPQPPVE